MKNLDRKSESPEKICEGELKREKLFLGKFSYENIIHKLIGFSLILFSLFIFVFFTIWILISKLKSLDREEDSAILNFIIWDKHYCLALPLLIPVSFIVLYLRWISFNYFKYC
jgi:hypothetical protein